MTDIEQIRRAASLVLEARSLIEGIEIGDPELMGEAYSNLDCAAGILLNAQDCQFDEEVAF